MRTLHLHHVTGLRQHCHSAHVTQYLLLQRPERVIAMPGLEVTVALAANEVEGCGILLALETPPLRPAQVHSAVPVEPAGEAGARVLADEELHLELREPCPGQRRRLGQGIEIGCAGGVLPDVQVVVVAAQGVEHLGQELARLRIQRRIRRPRRFEVVNVNEVIPGPALRFPQRWQLRIVRRCGIFKAHDRAHALGMAECEVVDRKHAEVQADKDRRALAQMIEQPGEIADGVIDVVGRRVRRRIRLTHPAHVGSHHAPARRSQRRNLMAPRKPQVREAMTQHRERSLALLNVVHAHAVDLSVAMGPASHGRRRK